jgi:hypothetical protein
LRRPLVPGFMPAIGLVGMRLAVMGDLQSPVFILNNPRR